MKENSSVTKRRKYDTSFKDEVLQSVRNGRPVSEVARSLGIGENIIYQWKSHGNKQPATVSKENSFVIRRSAGAAQTYPRTV